MELKDIAAEMQPRSMAARDWVFYILRTAIVRGVLPGGMQLKQDEISTTLSVSHIPVREAFRQLEAQGLVRIYPNRGAVVTRLSRAELANIMDVRIILELGALRSAITHLDDDVLAHAESLLEQLESEKDCNRAEEINLQFHFTLYEAAGNPTLNRLIDQLHANIDRYIRRFYSEEALTTATYAQHRDILEACKNRDTELACAHLRTHLEGTKILLMSSPIN